MAVVMAASFMLTACGDEDGSGYIFKYTLLSDPENLDPQMATDLSSLNVIGNMFMGLLVQNASGGFDEAACESYTVSEDGLVYEFKIRQGIMWQSVSDFTAEMTAHDFVFAFRRLLDPETTSPHAKDFYCIGNAYAVNLFGAPVETLGVTAVSDYELRIELAYANANFLYLLTTTPAYPCNEEFFYMTKGKYGLKADAIASNGAFYLTSWLFDPYGKDNYLIMRRNISYNDYKTVYPYSINYFIARNNEEKKLNDFTEGDTDVIDYSGTDSKLLEEYKYESFETTSIGLVFNLENEYMNIPEVRQALSLSLDDKRLDSLPKALRIAGGIIPSEISVLNKKFRELCAEPISEEYNLSLSQLLWNSSLTQKEKSSLDGTTIIVPESFEYYDVINEITAQWQESLNFFCGVEVLNEREYNLRIKEGKYLIALTEIKPTANHPSLCFDKFVNNGMFDFDITELDQIMGESSREASLSNCVKFYSQAEKLLVENDYYLPLFYQSEYLLYEDDKQDISFNPFSLRLFFENAKKF